LDGVPARPLWPAGWTRAHRSRRPLELWPEFERDTATARLGQQPRGKTTALMFVAGTHLWRNPAGDPDAHLVLFRAGNSLGEIGLATAARAISRSCSPTRRRPGQQSHVPAHGCLRRLSHKAAGAGRESGGRT
jgi:hypothetical protein